MESRRVRRTSNHERLVTRIQSLCSELTDTIHTGQEQRQGALELAQRAIELATAVGNDDRKAAKRKAAKKR